MPRSLLSSLTAVLVPLALFAGGCDQEVTFPGVTAVGNPGDAKIASRSSGGVTLLSGSAILGGIDVTRCAPQDPADQEVGAEIDLLDAGPYDAPPGPWCALTVSFDSPLHYTGVDGNGEPGKGTFELDLDVPLVEIQVDSNRWITELDSLIIELGHRDWLERLADTLEDGDHLVLGPTDPNSADLAAKIATASALYEDLNHDGLLDAIERENPVGAGEDLEEGENEEDDDL